MTKNNQEKPNLSALIGMFLGGIFDELIGSLNKERIINTTASDKEICSDSMNNSEECEDYFEAESLDIELF